MPLNSKSDGLLWPIENLRHSASDPLPADIRLAVLGDPVSHSLSPEMQNAGLAVRAIPFQYARLWVKIGQLAEVFSLLREREIIGWELIFSHNGTDIVIVDVVLPAVDQVDAINMVRHRS